jgi:ferredoxin
MACKEDRYADNVPGAFYVDDQCIDCDACRATAPNHFDRNDSGGYSYVCRQPQTEEERASCQEALDGCPVEAIGDDGEE